MPHTITLPRPTRPAGPRRLLLLSAAISCALLLHPAHAQNTSGATAQEQTYSIPAQSLDAALRAWSRQSGIALSVDPALVRGLASPGFDGATARSGP